MKRDKFNIEEMAQSYCEMAFKVSGAEFNELSKSAKKLFFDRALVIVKDEIIPRYSKNEKRN